METSKHTIEASINQLEQRLREQGNEKICPVVALLKDGKLLIGLRHYTPDKWKSISVWTIPGGRCDAGEVVETTVRRETDEETGITDINITSFLGEIPGVKEGDIVYVFAGTTTSDPTLREPEKFSEWKWSEIKDIPENFINPAALDLIRKHLTSSPSC